MNSKTIRKINTARVFHAIRQQPGVSQSKLRAVTQVDRSTISTIVQQLELGGLIRKTKSAVSAAMGRPEDALEILGDAGALVGMSLEDGLVRVSVTGLDGAQQVSFDRPIPDDPQRLDLALADIYQDALVHPAIGTAPVRVRGIGLAIAEEHAYAFPLLRKGRLVRELESVSRLPVFVEEAINAAALAESHFGSARGSRNFLYVHTRQSVASALVLDGRVYHGSDGHGGNIAHFKVDPNGRKCSCGASGCLEAYVPEPALLERLSEFSHSVRSIAELGKAALANDPLVKTVLLEAGRYLGFALANVGNLLDLDEIVIAGDLALLADQLLPAVRSTLHANLLGRREIPIGRSAMAENEALKGSVALAMNSFLPGLLDGEMIDAF